MGEILVEDRIRPGALRMIESLQENGLKSIQMLTGDDHGRAAHIAGLVGIKEFYAGLLPEQKLNHIRDLQAFGCKVAMIGDGINDAPSLAAADVGIAMGAMGTDVAVEAADIALMNDDLTKLPYLFRLSRSTIRIIQFNIAFAVIFNALALIASGSGWLNPIWGAITHNIGSLLVVLNSARLIRLRADTTLANLGQPV
jgi:Cd2+/Zn2+-exporting ATPase